MGAGGGLVGGLGLCWGVGGLGVRVGGGWGAWVGGVGGLGGWGVGRLGELGELGELGGWGLGGGGASSYTLNSADPTLQGALPNSDTKQM